MTEELELWDDNATQDNLIELDEKVDKTKEPPKTDENTDVDTDEVDETDVSQDDSDTKTVDTKTKDTSTDSDEVIKTYFELLVENNLLNLPKEDIESFKGTEEDLNEKLVKSREREREAIVQEIFNSMPEDGKKLFSFMLNGGTDIASFTDIVTKDVTKQTFDTPEKQEQIVREFYKEKGFNDTKVDTLVTRSKDLGELEEESKEALAYFKEKQEKQVKQLEEQTTRQREAELAKQKEQFDELNKFLDATETVNNIPIKKNKQTIIDSLTKPIKLKDGTVTTSFDYKLEQALADKEKISILAALLENDFKTDFIESKVKTKQVKSLRDRLREVSKTDSAAKLNGKGTDGEEIFDLSKATLG